MLNCTAVSGCSDDPSSRLESCHPRVTGYREIIQIRKGWRQLAQNRTFTVLFSILPAIGLRLGNRHAVSNPEQQPIGESASPKIVPKSASGPLSCQRDLSAAHVLEAGFSGASRTTSTVCRLHVHL